MRAREKGSGSSPVLSTAASRWRPPGLVGVAWRSEEGTSARKEGGEEHQCDAWRLAGRRWCGEVALHGGRAGGALHSGGENRAKELEEGEKDLNEISKIARDQTVK